MRDKFNLPVSNQEITLGNKFSFALYFDKDLKINNDMTFLTESFYIRNFHKIPSEKEFKEYEEDFNKKIQEIFDCPENKAYKDWFNKAILNILKMNKIDINNCRMKPLKNLETDAINLHSFFINDLQKAKSVHSKNLNDYLPGDCSNRKDLDSRSTSLSLINIFLQRFYSQTTILCLDFRVIYNMHHLLCNKSQSICL